MTTRTLPRLWSFVLRIILGVDVLLIALSFTPWFSGDAEHAGLADRLFRPMSGDGFRVDFLYVFASGLFAFVMLFILKSMKPPTLEGKIDVWLCTIATFGTVAYIVYALLSGVLDFG